MTAKKSKTPSNVPGYDQEELDAAAALEDQEMGVSLPILLAQKQHLINRVVLLRTDNMRLRAEVDRLTKAGPQDRRAPRKAAPKKKT
jgi:hypothetical protein